MLSDDQVRLLRKKVAKGNTVEAAAAAAGMSERFDSQAKAPRVAVPALLLHGTDDEVVPYAMGVKLSTAFPRARLITVTGGHHTDLFLGEGSRLFDRVADFVRHPN